VGTAGRVLPGRPGRRLDSGLGNDRDRRSGDPVAPGDPEAQTRRALETVVEAIEAAGGGREHVVRTRIYVTDADDWETVGEVHGEFFGDVRPASSMVEVSSLIGPEYVVEVEAEAVVPDEG
jgi:enamine deaminase RidA (YjgF/YER057c/UK114 family)